MQHLRFFAVVLLTANLVAGAVRAQTTPQTDTAGQVTYRLTGRKTTMTYLALMLVLETRRPVIDRTGISGEFNFDVDYAPLDSNPPRPQARPSSPRFRNNSG